MATLLFQAGNSPLHRLNPAVKLLGFSGLTLTPTLFLDPATPAAFLGLAFLIGWGLGGIRPGRLAQRLAPLLLVAAGLAVFNSLFYAGPRTELLLAVGPLKLWLQGVAFGLSLGLRVLCVAAYSVLFVLTTDPTRFVASLIQQARLPYRLGYAVLAAYRFLPVLQRELANIRNAHQVRGAYSEDWSSRLGQVRRYGIPLLANGIRQAERLAVAMDARGFGALPERTYYVQTRVGGGDYLFLTGTVLAAAAILSALAFLGLLQGFLAGVVESGTR